MPAIRCRKIMVPLRIVGAAVALAMTAAGTPFGHAVAAESQVIEMPDGLKYTDNKLGDGASRHRRRQSVGPLYRLAV